MTNQHGRGECQFASYSWAGWKGRVDWFEHVQSVGSLSPLQEPIVWAREYAWISWFELGPNGSACSILDLPEAIPDKSHLKLAARTRLKKEIPSVRRDVEQAVLEIKYTELTDRYPYPLLTFMTVSVLFKVCINAGYESEKTSFYELSDKNSDFCGYIWYDHSAPEISKIQSEFILLSETNYGRKKIPSLQETEVQRDDLQAQSDDEEALSIHSVDRDTINQMPWNEIYAPVRDRWDYYWVLLIEWDNGVAERRGIGKILKTAAEKSFPPGPVWKQIVLA